ncbi:hypothetical protein [Campylobacter hyointestinalis]|uniref:hypothetical protein n=1 Tax=Campylobacter hyointestinalis TaxID=198 RepID=UPI00075190BD|nr:hypothetical protein [Campylobacter hyointestinalis]
MISLIVPSFDKEASIASLSYLVEPKNSPLLAMDCSLLPIIFTASSYALSQKAQLEAKTKAKVALFIVILKF